MPATRMSTIDAHVHLYTCGAIDGFQRLGDAAHIDSMGVACICSDGQRINLLGLLAKALRPATTFVFGGLDYTEPGARAGAVDFAAQAEGLMELGCDGMKMIEGKPNVRRDTGLALDAPVYDGYYRYLEQNSIPVLFHVADPEEFWDERTAPKFAVENKWVWADPSYPTKEQLYRESQAVLVKFPRLKVIFAHFYFLSADLARASALLDRWPNVCIDITPGSEMYYGFSRKAAAWRDFFVKYQDRIVFGTDNVAHEPKLIDWGIDNVARIRAFLETDTAFSGAGLALPKAVTQKIYATNFKRVVGSKPKKVDTRKLVEAIKRLHADIGRQSGAKANYAVEVEAISKLAAAL